MGDLLLDVCFLLSGIVGTVFVFMKRKHFDIWTSLPTCTAWILKGVRHLYYDWVLIVGDNIKEEDIYLFIRKAHLTMGGIDALVQLLLSVAFVRFVIVGLKLRSYKKALKSLNK